MSQNGIVSDPEVLVAISDGMGKYGKESLETLEESIRKLKANSDQWNDEDFNALLSAITSFMADMESIEATISQLQARINNKIDLVRELHSMEI